MANEDTRIYIDTCLFIDLIKNQMKIPYRKGEEKQAGEVELLKALLETAGQHKITLITSQLTQNELIHVKENKQTQAIYNKEFIDNHTKLFKSGRYLVLASPTPWIQNTALKMVWVKNITSIATLDRLHIATAIETKCKAFITNDKGMLKKADKIQENFDIEINTISKSIHIPSSIKQLNVNMDFHMHDKPIN